MFLSRDAKVYSCSTHGRPIVQIFFQDSEGREAAVPSGCLELVEH